MDDTRWFWSSEYGRDRLLREEVEGLQHETASARATSSRLSSQLSRLQGSIESRLSALSEAFDAYVELGDVREQLAASPDTSSIRHRVALAIEDLSAGRPARPVDPRGLNYWLPYAMNAVIALTGSRPDVAAEEQARSLSRDADLFIVAALGALGHGERVAGRVADLLVGDGFLNARQLALWQAVLDGAYGPVLEKIGPIWSESLTRVDDADWAAWATRQSERGDGQRRDGQRPDEVEALVWIEEQITPTDQEQLLGASSNDSAMGGPSDDHVGAGLRRVVSDLVAEGMDNERELLERSRALRARIESPNGPAQQVDEEIPSTTVAVVDAVRSGYLESTDFAVRQVLLGWMRPGLLAAVRGLGQAALQGTPVTASARTPGGEVVVNANGVDQGRKTRAVENINEMASIRPATLIGFAIAAGVLAVLALILATATTQTALAVFLLLGALVCAGLTFKAWRDRRAADQLRRHDLERLDEVVAQAETSVRNKLRAQQESAREAGQLSSRLESRLQ